MNQQLLARIENLTLRYDALNLWLNDLLEAREKVAVLEVSQEAAVWLLSMLDNKIVAVREQHEAARESLLTLLTTRIR